jgi:excisionase family DNA binding protein
MIAPDTRVAFNGVAEAARATGLKPHHLRLALASGELQSHRVGRRTLILKENLIEFIRSRPAPKSSRRAHNEQVATRETCHGA